MTPLEQETLRLNQRYLEEVVEHFQLCPWAKTTRSAKQLRRCVLAGEELDYERVLAQIDQYETDLKAEIVLLIFPEVALDRPGFERWVSELIRVDNARHPTKSAWFALAAFHPNAEADFRTAARLIPYIRRTPDPTIQLVRMSALERVRSTKDRGTHYVDLSSVCLTELLSQNRKEVPTLRERIATANWETLKERQVRAEEVLSDISADHRSSRLRLARAAKQP